MTALNVDTYWLHEAIMVLVIVLFVGVFGVMFWSCYAHRKSAGHKAPQFHKNIMVEIVWTVIPAIIMALVAWPVTKVVIAKGNGANAKLAAASTPAQNDRGNKTAGMIRPAEGQGKPR